jgi:uncharacterized repeat protein (TIGR02543 family)
MSLKVTLQPRDPAALAAEVEAVSTPGSSQYHQFITPAEFAQLYGPTPATIAQVTSALRAEGLSVGAVSGTDLYLPITGTVAQTESVFATPILSFTLPSGRTGFYNTAAPSVPSSVAPEIEGIVGLDTLNVAQPVGPLAPRVKSAKLTPHEASPALASGQPTPGTSCSSNFSTLESSYKALSADDLAQAYSLGTLYNNGDYGKGSTVALVELEGAGYRPSDISTFATCYGITLGANQVTEETNGGNNGATGANTGESELDIETVLSLAPAANIKVYEDDDIYDAFSHIVSDDTAKIVSVSWGACESQSGSANQQAENTLLEEASLDGQTIFAAAGDNGSQGCNANGAYGSATGSGANAQAVNSSNGTLYVANEIPDTVSVINEKTEGVVATITTQSEPSSVVYDSVNSELYVANTLSDSVTEVSTTSCNSTTTTGCTATANYPSTTFLNKPVAMALDGSTLYIGNQGAATVAVFDTASNRFLASKALPSGATSSAIVVASGHEVYVADGTNNAVDYFSGSTCTISFQTGCATVASAITGLSSPDAMTLDPSNGDVYVANGGGGIGVISTSSNTLVTTISTSNSPVFSGSGGVSSIAMSPDGDQVLAIVHTNEDVLATIVPGSQTVSGTVGFNTGTDAMGQLVSDSTTNDVWVTDTSGGSDIVEDLNLAVNDPASQPDVTGVGGTTVTALGPAPTEKVWNDNDYFGTDAGGGGISQTFDMPTYQQALGTVTGSSGTPCANATGSCREVPDVAADADPYTGYIVYDSVNGYNWTAFGGTSAASPLWAAALADISSADGTTATGYGSLNPALYSLAGTSPGTYFNDVKTGNNDYNGTSGGSYPAMTGYDMATGLGTPIVSALVTGLGPAFATVPGAPTLTTATPGNGQVVLDWTAPSGNGWSAITGYDILRGLSSGGESATPYATVGNVLTYTDPLATNGTKYYYEVEAVNTVGPSVVSNELLATPATVPGAPTLTTATPGNAQVVLDWTAPSSNGWSAITGYDILRGLSSGGESATPYATVGNILTYTDLSATNGTKYYYEVEAVNTVGPSVVSNELLATPAPTTFTVTFSSSNGGTGTMAPETESSPTALTLNTFTRTGYTFTGWNTVAGGTGTAYADGATYPFSASLTLYAQWTVTDTITFNSESGSAVSSMSGPQGSTITLAGAPTLAGSTFDGWFVATSGGTALTSPYTLTSSLTLYAQWTANATVTVTFNSGGGTAVSSMSGPQGSTITLPAAPTLAGSTFDGWFLAATGGPALTSPYTLTSSLTLYAQWAVTDTITFNSGSGSAVSSMSGPQGSTITLPAAPTLAGSTFDGWFSATSGGPAITSPYTLTSSLTLYAQWTANATVTITFNSESGSAVNSMSGPSGTTITLPAAPTLAGSTFDGWFLAATGGPALTSPYTLTSSLTLYAQWTANATVTITFNSESGSAVNSMSGPSGATITLPTAPTLAGSTFDGWFVATSGGPALTSPYTLTSSLTLYAQWTANATVTITFNSGGGSSGPTTPTVSISNIPSAAIYGGQFTPSFTTSGNGTVFSVTSSTASVCTVSGSTVNFVGAGECTLTPSVAATVTYSAATGSSQGFEVGPGTATVSITNPPVSPFTGAQFTPSFTTSGDGTVFSVTSSTASVCTVSGSAVNFVGAGTCGLTVSVGATADYLAASNTSTISVKSIPKKLDTRTTVALSRTAISYRAENSVAIVVHVTPQASGPRLSGKVRIMVGNRLRCVATINSLGVAQCTLAARTLGRGAHSVEATYEGNSSYNQSTSAAVKLRVN